MSIPNVPISLNTSDNNLDTEFYIPCLSWATRYDRGVGFFTSGWISKNAVGLANFASRKGTARWITSPILDEHDFSVIKNAPNKDDISAHFREVILRDIDRLANEIASDTLNALGWMIYDNILEFRFAVPTAKLDDGDFHDKFGIFYGPNDMTLSFISSQNDSIKGFRNYESFKVFKSWEGMQNYVNLDIERFERLWENDDDNVEVMTCDKAIEDKLIKLRKSDRPYQKKEDPLADKWQHQIKAIEVFMREKHGILEMATGTGKTRTALKITSKLFTAKSINRVIITMYGNDLLSQWYKEVLSTLPNDIRVYRYFDVYKELPAFLLSKEKSILIVSRDADRLSESIDHILRRFNNACDDTFFVFDEVHGLGSQALRSALAGEINRFTYRLGLSATPDREYDDEGNQFIRDEVGGVIFQFTLDDAIKKGILCEFSYFPLDYSLTPEEKQEKRSIIARYNAKKKNREPFKEEDMYRDLARVNKTSTAKLPLFCDFIEQSPNILDRSIIFVETRDYGLEVQKRLVKYMPNFHTYYGEDDEENLKKFGSGSLNCLLTCKKISEGVDIKSVNNIILFSSDRGRLTTTQRIGRSLRINPADPGKRANVVDFICVNPEADAADNEASSDQERKEWLSNLSDVRSENNAVV